ncbi:hypothetical protein EJ08DRAFT_589592 [Tothia fuscella]|uniref:Uncharacterized protein n=1 Tax=Tothia fuscella TaxID=1048955 RepID=A0A9P4NR17_9PEZI|nr:hypothetical protein EJ08DRAFT_589592 [Tothia fuscella]
MVIDLTIALTIKGLGQELHVLFILSIIGTTIFFAHSVIRLCIMALRPPRERRRGLIPSVAGPEGFAPDVPIQVQLARDEEIAAQLEDGRFDEEKIESIAQPPPAYGLWRCSVRINPNLLHWQRVAGENSPESPVNDGARSPPGSPTYPIVPSPIASSLHPILETRDGQPRPPSYISDDGVSYVVSALPGRPPSEIHPAFRIRLP